ncbi:hypothetical protein C2G38_2029715 [Gigaspora rosea]|uniref:Protein kinase domain-containing protein n=1 Tax=Gigaspora rosea TaxID=44941 RepID=A0A397W1A8_9GLOM|nr:hypothetical protein C2G38_2029715 [Gigaspora rosea]
MTDENEIKFATQEVGNTFHGAQGNNIQVIVRIPVATEEIKALKHELSDLKHDLFLSKTDNTKRSSSVCNYVKEHGCVQTWEIMEDKDIKIELELGRRVFTKHPIAPTQGSSEITVNQPFCKKVVNEIVNTIHLGTELLVLGDYDGRQKDEVYADIIIGHTNYRRELTNSTNSPPDLSKGLGWEVKNELTNHAKVKKGKGQLIKYARKYLTAESPQSDVFYGCLTDGKLWIFTKIQLLIDDDGSPKMKFEESSNYEWSVLTATIIVGLIDRYYFLLIKKKMNAAGEKKVSQNNDDTYMYRNKPSISSESLLAFFIEEGIHIRLNSGKYIHVQITSHLGIGRECIVFLAQVRDYKIKDAVLKIEVRKNTEISQVYHEISALKALDDLSCVPKILFEGYTREGYLALLTDFAGQPLESWISDNGNIDDYTIFQIILDLLSCLEKIHIGGYTHGDVAIRNVIQRNGHFYLIDFGLATLLQLHFNPCQAIIKDYDGLCQIIGIIKFGRKMSLLELIDKLKGELRRFVESVEDASKWKITNEEKWLEKFGAKVKQLYERDPTRSALLNITENNIL